MRGSQARSCAARNYLGAPMEKLIITVACDSRTSYPHNQLCPPQEDIPGVAQQYIDAVNAGAAIAHIHGRRTLEETIQADGRQVSRIHHADWKRLQDAIMNKVDPIMQFGVASARIEEKIKLMELGPDMMAVCFNAHDEYFQPEPSLPPKRMMGMHPVEEVMAYGKAGEEHKVKLECECFTTGAFWQLEFVRKQGYLRENTYTTLFIGWPSGTWTPPTERALQFMVDNLPQNCIWNVSVMNPQKQWPILALAVALGGHVRVGYEDNPYIAPGEFAKNNAGLVERMASIARGRGRGGGGDGRWARGAGGGRSSGSRARSERGGPDGQAAAWWLHARGVRHRPRRQQLRRSHRFRGVEPRRMQGDRARHQPDRHRRQLRRQRRLGGVARANFRREAQSERAGE